MPKTFFLNRPGIAMAVSAAFSAVAFAAKLARYNWPSGLSFAWTSLVAAIIATGFGFWAAGILKDQSPHTFRSAMLTCLAFMILLIAEALVITEGLFLVLRD